MENAGQQDLEKAKARLDTRERQLKRGVKITAVITSLLCLLQSCVRLPLRQLIPAVIWLVAGLAWPLIVFIGLRSRSRLRALWIMNLICILVAIVGLIISMIRYGTVFLDVAECATEEDMLNKMDYAMSCRGFHIFMFVYLIISVLLVVCLVVETVFTYELLSHIIERKPSLTPSSQISGTVTSDFMYFPTSSEYPEWTGILMSSGHPSPRPSLSFCLHSSSPSSPPVETVPRRSRGESN